jgi:hypothetical protein
VLILSHFFPFSTRVFHGQGKALLMARSGRRMTSTTVSMGRSDMTDRDGAPPHGDKTSGVGETGEDAPNEPNFDETTSSVEPEWPIQVTENHDAPS